jgi:hypothetical protein
MILNCLSIKMKSIGSHWGYRIGCGAFKCLSKGILSAFGM